MAALSGIPRLSLTRAPSLPPTLQKNIVFGTKLEWMDFKIAYPYCVALSDHKGIYISFKSSTGATNRVFQCPVQLKRRPRFGKAKKKCKLLFHLL